LDLLFKSTYSIKDKWLLFHNPPTGSILNKIGIKEWGMAVWNWAYKEGDKYVRMYKYLMKKRQKQ